MTVGAMHGWNQETEDRPDNHPADGATIRQPHFIDVHEGGEYETKRIKARSGAYTELKDAIESQDWTNICIWSVDAEGRSVEQIATLAVMLDCDQPPEESICDWVVSEYADEIMNAYGNDHPS